MMQTSKAIKLLGILFLLAVLLPVPQAAAQVSWWPGEGNANDVADGNDGTLQGGTTFAAGKVGQAFSFSNRKLTPTPPEIPQKSTKKETVSTIQSPLSNLILPMAVTPMRS